MHDEFGCTEEDTAIAKTLMYVQQTVFSFFITFILASLITYDKLERSIQVGI
jgi:hypothetical protein